MGWGGCFLLPVVAEMLSNESAVQSRGAIGDLEGSSVCSAQVYLRITCRKQCRKTGHTSCLKVHFLPENTKN